MVVDFMEVAEEFLKYVYKPFRFSLFGLFIITTMALVSPFSI